MNYTPIERSVPAPKVAPPQEPTPEITLRRMVDHLQLTEEDVLADLGCGDGRVLIEAVNRYGCNGVGIEIDPKRAEEARKMVYIAGLDAKIKIITGDALEFSPEKYKVTAITTYLYPDLLEKLSTKLNREGIRVWASPFHKVPRLAMTQYNDVWVYRSSI